MNLTNAQQQAIVNLFNKVNEKPQDDKGRFISTNRKSTSGYFYVTGDNSVQVVMPLELLEFSNSRSGTMSGIRPVGIRGDKCNTAGEAADKVADIFSSVESLTQFITNSEADIDPEIIEICKNTRISFGKVKTIITDDRKVTNNRGALAKTHGDTVFLDLALKFGRDIVKHDMNTLTINEFELRYGL